MPSSLNAYVLSLRFLEKKRVRLLQWLQGRFLKILKSEKLHYHSKVIGTVEGPGGLEGRCRSTSAKPAVRRSPQQRTSQVHRTGVRNCKDISNSPTNYLTYNLIRFNYVLINLYLRIRSRNVFT